jgi:hypothetical protein
MQKTLVVAAILLFVTLPEVFASAAVSVTGLVFLDKNGEPVQNVKLGDKVSVQSSLNTNNQTKQTFVYIVQVQDSDGYAVFLAWASGTLQNNQTSSVSWEPENEGRYIVQAFVWTSIDSPAPISFAAQESIIDVIYCSGSASCFIGTVTKVTDGDTIRVDGIAIRLALVNTPERGAAGYSEATAFTSSICPVGATALVDEDDGQTEGSYGRMVAKIYCGKMLNEELLLAGHAEIYTQFCNVSEFGAEDWAIRQGC